DRPPRPSARRNTPARGELVDCLRQNLRQRLAELLRIDTELRCQRTDPVRAEDLLNVSGGDRLVRARADPGLDRLAEALLLKLGDDALDSAMLLDQMADDGCRATADHSAHQAIQNTHVTLLPVGSTDQKRQENTRLAAATLPILLCPREACHVRQSVPYAQRRADSSGMASGRSPAQCASSQFAPVPTSTRSGTRSSAASVILSLTASLTSSTASVRTSRTNSSCTCMMSRTGASSRAHQASTAIMARLMMSAAVPCM